MKFGVVGTNFISDTFMQSALTTPKIEVVGVCSGKYENAKKFQEKYNLKKAYLSFEDLIADPQIEMVYIATPNAMHFPLAMQALSAGKHIFVEKPFALNPVQAKKIYDFANKHNLYVHDGLMPIYLPQFQTLKERLHEIGKIRRATFSFSKYSSRYDQYRQGYNPTTFQKALGNGALMDLGIYCLSNAVGLFGKPNQIQVVTELLESGVDATTSAILKYDGFHTLILCSKVTDSNTKCEIEGEDGQIHYAIPSTLEKITKYDRITKQSEVIASAQKWPFQVQLQYILDHFEHRENIDTNRDLSFSIIEVLYNIRKQMNLIYEQEGE